MTQKFFKHQALPLLYPYGTLTSCKKLGKTNEQSLRYLKTDGQGRLLRTPRVNPGSKIGKILRAVLKKMSKIITQTDGITDGRIHGQSSIQKINLRSRWVQNDYIGNSELCAVLIIEIYQSMQTIILKQHQVMNQEKLEITESPDLLLFQHLSYHYLFWLASN